MAKTDASGYDCTYCGMNASDLDHVLPKSYTGSTKFNRDECVPACKECNGILWNWMILSIAERAEYVARRLQDKHQALLKSPDWSEAEYSELSGRLLKQIRNEQRKKKVVKARVAYAQSVALMVNLTVAAVWESQHEDFKEEHRVG